jgi:hypothetical protein
MNNFELTGNTKKVEGVDVFQIRAIQDVSTLVKKGDLGGFTCKRTTMTGESWISPDAVVIASHFLKKVYVMGNAIVLKSRLSGECHIQDNARLVEVEAVNLFAMDDCRIEKSYFKTKRPGRIGCVVAGSAYIRTSTINFTGEEKDISIKIEGDAKLVRTTIEGWDMDITENSSFKSSLIKGYAIYIAGLREMKSARLRATKVRIVNVRSISESTIKGNRLTFEGDIHLDHVEISSDDSIFRGKGMSISNSWLHGEKILVDDYAELSHVEISGDGVQIVDYAMITGLEEEPVIVGDDVVLFDFVKIEMEKGAGKLVLRNKEIGGDKIFTGKLSLSF